MGPTLITRWSGQRVTHLLERVLVSMPEDDLFSVSRQAQADIMPSFFRRLGEPEAPSAPSSLAA